MYKCLDGTLIPLTKVSPFHPADDTFELSLHSKVCDFIVDCKGGDDERSCGNCTFDDRNTLCGWRDVKIGRASCRERVYGLV